MALADILAAITQQTDERIAQARAAHQKELSDLRDESERTIAKKKQDIALSKEQKKDQMRLKAQAHATMIQRNAELKKKQELLDQLYSDVVAAIAKQPEKDLSPLFESCLASIDVKGTIRPAKAHAALLKKLAPDGVEIGDELPDAVGGFIFESAKQEHDFTLEHLVASRLRPQTEVEAAHTLFA